MIPILQFSLSLEIFKGLNITFKRNFYRAVEMQHIAKLHNLFASTVKLNK